MIRNLIIIYLLLNLLPLQAQVQYFNKSIGKIDRAELFDDVISKDSFYYIVGAADSFSFQELVFLKISKSGDSILQKSIRLGNENRFGRSIIPSKDNNFIIASFYKNSFSAPFQFNLTKVSDDGNIIWDKVYNNSGSEGPKKVIQTSTNDYLMVGTSVKSPNQEAQFHIKKIDSAGNLMWEKDHGQSNTYENGYDVIETADGGFIITGSKLYYNSNNNQDFYIVKTDSAGTFQWDKTYGGPYYDGGIGIINSKEGGYLLSGAKRITEDIWKGWLIKIDTLGNVEWEKQYNEQDLSVGTLSKTIQLEDSSYVIIGYYKLPPNKYEAWIFKTDMFGNKLWSRTYNPNPQYHSYFYAFDTTADGGFIACGSTHPYTQDGWIVKMDEYGCDTADCHLADTTIGIPGLDPSQHWEMNIYPNPNTGYFTLSVTAPDNFSGEMDADIFNISGQMIWNRKIYISEGKNEEQLEISAPAGIYFLRIRSGLDTVIQKFVIE